MTDKNMTDDLHVDHGHGNGGCCGGGHCGDNTGDDGVVGDTGGCCGGGHCHDDDDLLVDTHGECCGGGCGGGKSLTVEQIAQVNEILGDIDDEDLASGNYDLSDEDLEKLRRIFG